MNKALKNRGFFIFCLIIFFFILSFQTLLKLRTTSDTLTSLTTINPIQNTIPELLKDQKVIISFESSENMLGIMGILINTHNRENTDQIIFRIKEKGAEQWYYENTYDAKSFTNGEYYPFGFPKIINSEGKSYIVEIFSQKESKGNSIGILGNSKYYIKYVYTKSDVKKDIVPFFFKKLGYFGRMFSSWDYLMIFSPFFIFLLIYYLFKKSYQTLNSIFYLPDHFSHIRAEHETADKNTFVELLLVSLFFTLFMDLALLSPYTMKQNIPLFSVIFIISLNVLSLVLFIRLFKATGTLPVPKISIGLIVSVVSFCLVRLFFMKDLPRWDSANNFMSIIQSVRGFDFTFNSFLYNYGWWGHSSHGIGMFVSLFQFFGLGNIILLHLAFLFLSVLGIVSLHIIFSEFIGENEINKALFVLLVIFNPFFFSSSLLVSPDFAVLIFFICFLACFLKKKYILAVFCALLFVFSKETGMMIYFVFISSYGMVNAARLYRLFKKNRIEFIQKVLFFFIPIFVFVFYVFVYNGRVWGGSATDIPSSFKFSFDIFYQRFLQMFVLNFGWIMSMGFTAWILLGKKMLKYDRNSSVLYALLITDFLFILFNLFYNTVTHPRYVVLQVFFSILFFSIIIAKHVKNILYRRLFITAILILSVIQSIFTIDPVSKWVFGAFSFGNRELLKISDDFSSRCDSMVYNTEFVYINRLLNLLNKSVNIKSTDTIIFNTFKSIPDREQWLAYYEQAYVNKTTLELTYENMNSFKPNVFYANSLPNISVINQKGDIYYVFLPWLSINNQDYQLAGIKKLFRIIRRNRLEINGYYIKVYKLAKF